MINEVLAPDIQDLIANKNWAAIRDVIANWPAPEIADLLLALPKTDRAIVFRVLPRAISSEVFAYLTTEQQNQLLKELTDEETRQLLAGLSPDDRTALLEELPGRASQKLLNLLSPEDLAEARKMLGYPEDSVGRLMTPDYVAVRRQWTISQALAHIRARGRGSETINVVYVVDEGWKLLDAIELRRFIFAEPEETVESIMDGRFVSVRAFDDREEAVRVMQRYDLDVLPVVDSDGVLVGIVTADDVLDVAQEEATEDFHRTAAVAPLKANYKELNIFTIYRKRIGWLLALVFMNIFSGAAIAAFEETIAAVVALVFFLPLLIDSSGNAGAQSATLMVRALATGDVRLSDWGKLLGRELFVGGMLGATMALAVLPIGALRGGPEVAAVVALTMLLIVIVGSTIGLSLPFILSKFKLDPAAASAPLITSLSDISGVLIYFSLATWLLNLPS
ncbi:MAG: magnesium transporter [Candidatus Brachytrichaceae bacterium NZ_4S206]|jgi:magnesium transporter